MGILGLGERQRVRLFVCRDRARPVRRLPGHDSSRPLQHREPRTGRRILLEAFGGILLDWRAHLSESVLVRVYYIVRCPHGIPPEFDVGRDRGTAGQGDARLERRSPGGAARGARRGAGRQAVPALRARVPARLPLRLARPRSRSLTSAASSSSYRTGEPILSLYRPLEAPEGLDALQAVQLRAAYRCRTCCRRSSTWAPTSSTSGPYEISPRRIATASDLRLRLALAARTTWSGYATSSRKRSSASWRGELEDDGTQWPGAGGRAHRP